MAMDISMNPFIRVAYDVHGHALFWITRKFERLYPLAHSVLSSLVEYPARNPCRAEVRSGDPQQSLDDRWQHGKGGFQTVERRASNDGSSRRRGMEALLENSNKILYLALSGNARPSPPLLTLSTHKRTLLTQVARLQRSTARLLQQEEQWS
ncbi:hypothetical protein BDW68DRAFT_180874 [Aspergillus falconensis]